MDSSFSSSFHPAFLESAAAFAQFIEAFEQGTWPKAQWTHSAHLAVACWYLCSLPESEAAERVRSGIRQYNEAVGTANTADSGYHETLTLFWLEVITRTLGRDTRAEPLGAAKLIVDRFGARRDFFRDFYTFDVVKSREARANWMPPDLREIPWEQE
jgi:hypothetical protein